MTKPGYGTINNPASLSSALSGMEQRIQDGHTIYLRAGVYSGLFISNLAGSSNGRITVRPYQDERVIIDGGFSEAAAQYADYIDLEFTWSGWPDRIGPYYVIPDSTRNHSVNFSGNRSRLINCTVHDSFLFAAWDNVELVYGCISYNNGLASTVQMSSGHSLYSQNVSTTERKGIKHSILGRSANYGLHCYTTNFQLSGYDIVENVLFGQNNNLIGSQKADDDIVFVGNHAWDIPFGIGYGNHDHTLITCQDNIFYGENYCPFQIERWISGNIDHNLFVVGVVGGTPMDIFTYRAPIDAADLTAIDLNTYINISGKAACFLENGVAWRTLAQWQASYGHDANSTIDLTGAYPEDSVHVYPNDYAAISKRKGMIAVHNWSSADTVIVDLSTIAIDPGATYKLLNGQDPLSDIVTDVMPQNKIISVDMRAAAHTIASVDGWNDPDTTFPLFGAFILEI